MKKREILPNAIGSEELLAIPIMKLVTIINILVCCDLRLGPGGSGLTHYGTITMQSLFN